MFIGVVKKQRAKGFMEEALTRDLNLTGDLPLPPERYYTALVRGDKFRLNTSTTKPMDGSFTLRADEAIYSPLHTQQLIMQKDCNLVLYHLKEDGSRRVLWESGTKRKESSNEVHAWFQADFNLVVYRKPGEALWASGTYKKGTDHGTFNLWDLGCMTIDLFDDGKQTTYYGNRSGVEFEV